jgi:hypothetical protein
MLIGVVCVHRVVSVKMVRENILAGLVFVKRVCAVLVNVLFAVQKHIVPQKDVLQNLIVRRDIIVPMVNVWLVRKEWKFQHIKDVNPPAIIACV